MLYVDELFDKSHLTFYCKSLIIHSCYLKQHMHKSPKKQTLGLLKQANEILIVGPRKWDADTAAGILTLHSLLKKNGKNSIAVAPDLLPHQLRFLPNADAIAQTLGAGDDFVISIPTKSVKIKNVQATEHDGLVELVLKTDGTINPSELQFRSHIERFDTIVVIGADALEDCNPLFNDHPKLFAETPIINISVSPTNEFFGRVNFVDSSASAVCELIADLVLEEPELEKHLNADLATTLLSGILAATESFLAPNTSARAMELAAELQARNANQSEVIEHLFKQKSFANLRVLGRLLGNLQLDQAHQMAWTHLSGSDFELTETTFEDVDGWTGQLLRHINGTDIIIAFIEKDEDALIQVRTGNELAIDSLAKEFEGMVEKTAYGFDVLIADQSVPEIQSHALRVVADWQEARLRMEKTAIKKTTMEELLLEQQQNNTTQPPVVIAHDPIIQEIKNIPFEIPIKEE